MKFTIIIEDEDSNKITQEFEESVWVIALSKFLRGLSASGWFIDNNAVGINRKLSCASNTYHTSNLTTFREDDEGNPYSDI